MTNAERRAFYDFCKDSVALKLFRDWLLEASTKADKKAYHATDRFDIGYAAGLDVCCERFIEYVDGRYKHG